MYMLAIYMSRAHKRGGKERVTTTSTGTSGIPTSTIFRKHAQNSYLRNLLTQCAIIVSWL